MDGFWGVMDKLWYFIALHIYGAKFLVYELLTKHRIFDPTQHKSRKGHLAIVTGGGTGIGAQVVKKFLQADMDVIIGCKSLKSEHDLLKKFRTEGVKTGTLELIPLDLLSFASVREFSKRIIDKRRPVHVLVNNAGIMFPPYEVTVDGYESQFQVNHLSHFLLTHLLMPALDDAGTKEMFSRVINVSSVAHYGAWVIDYSELQIMPKDYYNPYKSYTFSKFCQVICSIYWNPKLKATGSYVTVNAVHPGIVATELYNQQLYSRILVSLMKFLLMSPEKGADTVVYAALSPELKNRGGLFLVNSKTLKPNSVTKHSCIQRQIWGLSCFHAGIRNSYISLAD